jgi:hypothetical protein
MGNFRDMAFGKNDFHSPSNAPARKTQSRLRHLVMTVDSQFKRGQPIDPPSIPTNTSTVVLEYPRMQGITTTTPTINGRTFSQLAIQFDRPADGRTWFSCEIYVKGYRANPDWVNIGHAVKSPAIVLLERTGETVIIALGSTDIHGLVNSPDKAMTAAVVLT